jgi:predicted YcjX-like family ATPase
VIVSDIADRLGRVAEGVAAPFSDTVIRLGVTGLSRAGKTVFITSLAANLMDRGRMPGLRAASEGRVLAVYLQPQPDDTVPRFDYETHLSALTGPAPHWPQSTRAISELRLSFKLQAAGMFGALRGPRTVHLDIVDYPGEWLLDLSLLDQGYSSWSEAVFERIAGRDLAKGFLDLAATTDPMSDFAEPQAKGLAEAFTAYLADAHAAGFSDCTPGRFLLPGDLAGSPVVTFAPLVRPSKVVRGSLWREMERRFDAYKDKVVKPFFRDHFSRIDRQIVLVDALGAIHAGPRAVEDMRRAMAGILDAFKPGRVSWLAGLLGARRVERILFAATKADHLHHSQHLRLTNIMAALMRDARDKADFAGANTAAMSIAALRATVEETVQHRGKPLDCVRGRLLDGDRDAAFYPGELPENPSALLASARQGAEKWLDADYGIMAFAPARISLKPGEGPPHIRLDRAAEFLLGDIL